MSDKLIFLCSNKIGDKMNKRGFVLAETLVVTIFVLIIFTVLYNGAVPLLGKYQELSYYDDLDVTYDLYQ